MTAGRRCRPETAVAGQTTVPCVRLQDTEDAAHYRLHRSRHRRGVYLAARVVVLSGRLRHHE